MNIWVIGLVGSGVGLLIIASLLYVFYKKKFKSKNSWESSKFMQINEFNKIHKKHIVNTKKIKKSSDPNQPAFKAKYNCGFLIASGKARAIPKLPLLPDNHFKKIKYGKEYHIKAYLLPKSHVVIFGGTGSGKTDTILVPNIILNSMSKERPSCLVFDPKGEIYEKTAPFLRAQGYKVININLSETANSDRWSPFQFAIDSGTEYIKYAFINSLLVQGGQIKQEIDALQKTKSSDAKTSINETASILIKMSDKESSVWTNTAIDLLSIAGNSLFGYLTMKAYQEIKEIEKYKEVKITASNYDEMKKQIFNDEQINSIINKHLKCLTAKNISNIIGTTSQQDWIRFAYSQGWHDKIGTFNATQDQFKSYLMNIANALSFLGGEDFEDFISASDFSYQDLIYKHTMIFINIPASAEKRKAIATLMVQQIWAFLELKSKSYKGGALPIPFYFYFEELANVPEIQCFKQILTLGRGMRIFAFAVVQVLQQFEDLYGQGATNIVWSNTMAHVYLLGQDNDTRDFISKQAGEIELRKEDGSNIIRPLLEPEKLAQIKEGECVIMESRKAPIWLNTASYSGYKLIGEWERENLLENKYKKSIFDFGNKKIKNKSDEELMEIKQKLNKKFTQKSDIPAMPNIINIFNSEEQINYECVILTQLIDKILTDNESQILIDIRNEIINKAIALYNNKDKLTDENQKSIENQIYDIFIEVIGKYVLSYSKSLIEKNPNKDINSEKGTHLRDELMEICLILKQKIIQFPYMEDVNNSMGLPAMLSLIHCAFSDLMSKNGFVIQKIKKHLINIEFIENFVKNKIKAKNIEKELALEIIEKGFESQTDELNEINAKKINFITSNIEEFVAKQEKEQDEIRIIKQEDQIDNIKEFDGDEFEFYLRNKLQIYKRIVIDFLISHKQNQHFCDYVKQFNSYNFPIEVINDDLLNKYHFNENLLVAVRKIIRAEEKVLEKFKNSKNIKFVELNNKFINKQIEEKDQNTYFVDLLIEWLESI